ncbi:acyl-CoA thioesterase [Halomonas urumqiensis]|uniref:Thioesterase n=1 Tax=Halomonas urumqiensis TaxID=1684789 RepID=A0A2N7UPX6_9GAMM|nr:thioesterase family protein [Halomonas urumqiensis]PMR82483.1 thioesterase [Halomonas urumqiensis]PTB04036.1 acyl-CoA thioesterase [Halomonas urumqiensis]GHE19704.1 thioesterase [Halomonas urumqiensis]
MDSRITHTTLRVRGFHLDGYGHVNNARYLEFMEEGRWAYFDERPELTRRLGTGEVAFVAVNLNIDYRAAAVAGDDLEVTTRLSAIGGRSARMTQEIFRVADGALVTTATLTFVMLDVKSNQAVPIDDAMRELMMPLVVEA